MHIIGGSPEDRQHIDNRSGPGLVWIEELSNSLAHMDGGHVTRWEFYARSPGVAVLQVWRMTDWVHLKQILLGSITANVVRPGYHAIDVSRVSCFCKLFCFTYDQEIIDVGLPPPMV